MIISLSMVKNEQDIIEPFIRHNARFVDCMIIVDNASVDDTRRIAMDCARELGTVIVADCEEFGYRQAERMTRLLQDCACAFFADFVLLLDADEFLGAADRSTLLVQLERIAPGGVGLMPWQTFVLRPDQGSAADPPRTMRTRRVQETPLYHKAVIRLDGTYRPDLLVAQGNHDIGTTGGAALPTVHLNELPLLHFPVRSHEQMTAKGVVGWMAYLAKNPNARTAHQGLQWRDAFDRAVSGGVDPAGLAQASLQYAQTRQRIDWVADVMVGEPPTDYVRRYSTGAFGDPIALIGNSWERSLSAPAQLLQLTPPAIRNNQSGASATSFDAAWHWDNLFVDIPPFRFIAEKYCPDSVLDIGCGVGAYLALFKRFGTTAEVLGVDGVPAVAVALGENEYLSRNLAQPLDLGREFSLVVCVEVAEHLDVADADILLDSITRHATGTIVFSAAEPGQPGHGHINCQPISYWLARFAARGWYPDLVDSLGMRALATLSWFRRNLVVMRRDNAQSAPQTTATLAAIGARSFTWYGQPPGIRQLPFTEAMPPPPAGYGA